MIILMKILKIFVTTPFTILHKNYTSQERNQQKGFSFVFFSLKAKETLKN